MLSERKLLHRTPAASAQAVAAAAAAATRWRSMGSAAHVVEAEDKAPLWHSQRCYWH